MPRMQATHYFFILVFISLLLAMATSTMSYPKTGSVNLDAFKILCVRFNRRKRVKSAHLWDIDTMPCEFHRNGMVRPGKEGPKSIYYHEITNDLSFY